MHFPEIVSQINAMVWGLGTQLFLVGTGAYLTVRTGFRPWRYLGKAMRSIFSPGSRKQTAGGVSPLASLMTALAATLGTGNLAGVSTALVCGGPGALVWMELSALFGISTAFAESMLSSRYRVRGRDGQVRGGPMYVMRTALRPHRLGAFLAAVFSAFTVLASFGVGGMSQSSAITDALELMCGAPRQGVAAVLSLLTLAVISGGIRRISALSSAAVPVMSALFLAGSLWVIFRNIGALPESLLLMLRAAFTPTAMLGGAAGTTISAFTAARYGIARGCYSNEAGMGSAAISAAAADGVHPVQQGYIAMTAPVIDTIILCTVTGLVVCVSGVLGTTDSTGALVTGAQLTILAFRSQLGQPGALLVCACLVLFGFSTIPGWEYMGEQALVFLAGRKAVPVYRAVFVLFVFLGCVWNTELLWHLSDICNALMCFPNLICLLLLSGTVAREIRAHPPETD